MNGSKTLTGSSRILIAGGIALIVAGMIFGDIFAVFVLHQNADRIGEALTAATRAVAARDSSEVLNQFMEIGGFLENRGTKVDTHVHVIDFGYLALLLALIQPFVALSEPLKRRLAGLFIVGAVMLPGSVFLIHYVGLKYSPFEAIGWASISADLGGLLVIIACAGQLSGLWRHLRSRQTQDQQQTAGTSDSSWSARALLVGGTLLVLAGFLHGSWYATVDLERHEVEDRSILSNMILHSRLAQTIGAERMEAEQAVRNYGLLQAEKAVKIAAHSHIIEFGLLAILLAFVQGSVMLTERWKGRWAVLFLLGSATLPLFVLLEVRLGLVAGGIADAGGLLVVVALIGMFTGIIRQTGVQDASEGAS
jgi:hypothetical protein